MVGRIGSPDVSPRLKSTLFLPGSYLLLLQLVMVETLQTIIWKWQELRAAIWAGQAEKDYPSI